MSAVQRYDAVIIGAGFAGMYLLHRLRDEVGLAVRVYERGDGVGGTWYWNRYPGARCDIESLSYSYSFSPELEQEWDWTERFATQPEILRYANHVADRFDLRKDIQFGAFARSAVYDETEGRWTVTLDDGTQASAAYVITAVGCLSASRLPDFEGVDTFGGEMYHTGRWPHEGVDFTGKRVAVIGTGSSGIQAIPMIAAQAAHVTVLQRTATFSVPARNRPLSEAERSQVKADYPRLRALARASKNGYVAPGPIGNALEVEEHARLAELRRRWDLGGTEFLAAFADTMLNDAANRVAAEFVRDRIREIVKDPAVAELLVPNGFPIGGKRLCLDTDYYATFNRDNVSLMSVSETPIERLTPTGLQVDGKNHEFDVIVFATGYDAMTGAINAIDICGKGGVALREEWAAGPRTYLGLATAGFPNLFMITGPGSPSVFSNMIVSIEQHVDWVTDLISFARTAGVTRVEAEVSAQDAWVDHVNVVAASTLHHKAASWYLGANIPGKPRVFMPYLGGVGAYRKICDEVIRDGYRGFALTRETPAV